MEVSLSKKIGIVGTDMEKCWTATITNDDGQVVERATSLTAPRALQALESRLTEAVRAVQEMRGREPKD